MHTPEKYIVCVQDSINFIAIPLNCQDGYFYSYDISECEYGGIMPFLHITFRGILSMVTLQQLKIFDFSHLILLSSSKRRLPCAINFKSNLICKVVSAQGFHQALISTGLIPRSLLRGSSFGGISRRGIDTGQGFSSVGCGNDGRGRTSVEILAGKDFVCLHYNI